MDHVQTRKFLTSQLFTLTALESTRATANLNPAALAACDDAIMVTASAIGKVFGDHPTLEADTDNITKTFFEVASAAQE